MGIAVERPRTSSPKPETRKPLLIPILIQTDTSRDCREVIELSTFWVIHLQRPAMICGLIQGDKLRTREMEAPTLRSGLRVCSIASIGGTVLESGPMFDRVA